MEEAQQKRSGAVCYNCGASFEPHHPQCPYCGHIYEPGARREYLEKIKAIWKDTKGLDWEARKVYHREAGSLMKRIGKLLLTLLLLILILAGLIFGISVIFSWEDEDDAKERLLWQNEHFPLLEECYEKGDFAEIDRLYFSAQAEEEHGDYVYSWEHTDLMFSYWDYALCRSIRLKLAAGKKLSGQEPGEGLTAALELLYYTKGAYYDEGEKSWLAQWQEEARGFLYGDFGFTQEEIAGLMEKAEDKDGWLDYGVCYDYAQEAAEKRGLLE